MQEVLQQMLVLLVLLLAGVALGKLGVLREPFLGQLNSFIIRVTVPALIVSSMDKAFTLELLRNSLSLIVISGCCFVAVIVVLELWSRHSRIDPRRLGIYQYLILIGNTAYMGYPVIQAVYGDTGVFYASMFNIWHYVVMFSYGMRLLSRGLEVRWRDLLKNVGLMATLLGFVLFLCPFTLPYVAHRTLGWIGDMTIPLCLLVAGSRMAQSKLRELVRPPAIWLTSMVRLVLFPAILIPILYFLQLPEVLIVIPSIIFATPVALTAGAFAEEYAGDDGMASRAVVLSNLLALGTMTVVVLILEKLVIGG